MRIKLESTNGAANKMTRVMMAFGKVFHGQINITRYSETHARGVKARVYDAKESAVYPQLVAYRTEVSMFCSEGSNEI